MVAATGTNTLGFIVWTLALAIVTWFATVVQQAVELRSKGVGHPFATALGNSAPSGIYTLVAVTVLAVLVWSIFVIVVIYKGHNSLVAENARLNAQLEYRATHGLSLRIGGVVISNWDADSTRVQLTVTASNDGDPTTARNWNLVLHTSEGDLNSFHAVGEQIAKGSPELPRLDSRLQEPIGEGVEVPGLVSFVFPHIARDRIEILRFDLGAKAVLSVIDRNGKQISTERSIHELAAERYIDPRGDKKKT